jgi:transglutaminase-like putative cysteine protease
MRYRIEREGRIRYPEPVREHHVQLRLAPWDGEQQSRTRLELLSDPPAPVSTRHDGFGNLTQHLWLLPAHESLAFTLICEIETRLSNPFDFVPIPAGRERDWIVHALHEAPRLWDFVLHQGALTPSLPDTLTSDPIPVWREGHSLLTEVQEAILWVQGVAEPDLDATESVSALPALFDAGRGSPADLSHLLITVLRRWGVPARFVSGYLDPSYFAPDDEAPAGTPPRAQRLHQWVEALLPGAGWRGFDPSLGLLSDHTYIRVAVGRDATDVRPLRQTARGGGTEPEILEALRVTRVGEEVRVDAETVPAETGPS